MAKARCDSCGVPDGRTKTYSAKPYLPAGHPNSGVICGTKGCRNHALAWLTLEDERQYIKGERVFDMDTAAAKIKVQ